MRVKQLYDTDFFEWTVRNAELLRAGRVEEVDIEHVAEELEDMGKSQRRALESRLEVLLAHLLKWKHQPDGRGSSWKGTIRLQRSKIQKLLREMPSLRLILPEALPDAYENAVIRAAAESGLAEETLPGKSPFTIDQILDAGFYPE